MISAITAIRPDGTEEELGSGEGVLHDIVSKFYSYAERKNVMH
jgi:hypothetical protein